MRLKQKLKKKRLRLFNQPHLFIHFFSLLIKVYPFRSSFLLFLSFYVGRLASILPSLSTLVNEATIQLKRHPALPSLTQSILFFVSEVLEQINEHHPQHEEYEKVVPDLLKVVNGLVINSYTQAQGLDTLYDVIIQGDCLKGHWKPLITCLKVFHISHSSLY